MAGYNLSAQIVGADSLIKFFKEMPDRVTKEMKNTLNTSARTLRDTAANNAPYRTGNLKASLHTEDATEQKLEAKVGTDLVYAKAVEFGLPARTISVANKRVLANRKTGQIFGRIVHQQARKGSFYMKRAVESFNSVFKNNLKDMMERIVKSYPFE